MEGEIMKNRYNYPPGLFGIGFIAAGYSARPVDVQTKETRPVFDGRGEITTESQSEPKKQKVQAWQRKRSGSGTRRRQ
jgi:hypothetical protein